MSFLAVYSYYVGESEAPCEPCLSTGDGDLVAVFSEIVFVYLGWLDVAFSVCPPLLM